MKLCKLKLKNLNSFRTEVELDFEKPPLDDASLVAITGPTGAGKSTLLDAICVALYGKTPRLSGNRSQHSSHLVSHGENEGFAEIEFRVNNTCYLATWSIRKRKSNNVINVQLFNVDDNQLISDKLSNKGKSHTSSENTVSEEVTALLGLDYDAFKRSVMLAQGEFAAFLKADKESRREILEATAGIHIYDILREKLNDKVNVVSDAFENINKNLEKIGEVSREQVKQEKEKTEKLRKEAKKFGKDHENIQKQKVQETQRKDNYKELQTSEKALKKLNSQQEKINQLKTEIDLAKQANVLLPEKQSFDNANSDHNRAIEFLQQNESQLAVTTQRKKKNQDDFDKKEKVYTEAVSKKEQMMQIYTAARTDLERATEKFGEVKKRTPVLEGQDRKVESTTKQLKEKMTQQEELNKQITNAHTFLKQNPLPSDRDTRRVKLARFLSELNSHEQQLINENKTQSDHKAKISDLKENLKKLAKNSEKLQVRETEFKHTQKETEKNYKILQDEGSIEDWQIRRDKAIKAQLIAQQYKNLTDQCNDEQTNLNTLTDRLNESNESLNEFVNKVEIQNQLCIDAEAVVNKLEAEKQLAILRKPINQLRQQLEEGQPCVVCGSTEHPHADKAELDSKELLLALDKKLDDAAKNLKKEQNRKQKMEREQVRIQTEHTSTSEQIGECNAEIESLNTEIEDNSDKWQQLFKETEISSDWAYDSYQKADTAITNHNATRDNYNKAISELNEVSQKRENCERDIKRESNTLKETKLKLKSVDSDVENINESITETKKQYWESMPSAFHGVTPESAFHQFGEKIGEVGKRELELSTKNSQLNVLKTEIQNYESSVEDLQKRQKELNTEIDNYQQQGENILQSVRENTAGLETEEQIATAINELEGTLKARDEARNKAEAKLQESDQDLTKIQTTHNIARERMEECKIKFEEAKRKYYARLKDIGFASTDEHENAIRDTEQMEMITEQISRFKSEKKQLTTDIEELRLHFEEAPYNPEELDSITNKETKIEELIEDKQQKIGAQNQKIEELNEALKKREDIEEDLIAAKKEMNRWKTLQDTIPKNTLRDFALEIIFKQMGIIANEQLRFLTSERYQLKVESIGELTVIDRWNANEERPVETLSGGESFLTSLALALALSELSQGRAQLNSLFLDEGFGTLDAETLDIAIASLEGLQMQGRSIYLISHVQELTRRLPVKIRVRKRGDGTSYIEKDRD